MWAGVLGVEMEKKFLRLDELQALGLPAARTLRNSLDARTGLIHMGGDVPPLRTLLVGGSRVVVRQVVEDWVNLIARGPEAAPPAAAEDGPPRRRGRPRKDWAGRGK